jgi:uncharacterized protein YjhX (UPF0386 family)
MRYRKSNRSHLNLGWWVVLPIVIFLCNMLLIVPARCYSNPRTDLKNIGDTLACCESNANFLLFQQLGNIEGYYRLDVSKAADTYIKITVKGSGIVLKQMWDGKEIYFKELSTLQFLNDEGNFPLKFIKDKSGVITQLLAFNRDLWIKVNGYKPPVIKEVRLNSRQLKACEGKYKMQIEPGKEAFIQIISTGKGLKLKQLWDGRELTFVPQSELDFSCKEVQFPLKFIKDKNGTVLQMLCFNKDLWNKIKN